MTAINSTNLEPSYYTSVDQGKSFEDEYTILNKIGEGTHSTVFLCRNRRNETVAVKRYTLNSQEVIDCLKTNQIEAGDFIKNLATNELEIGRLTDHPNIIKIREVIFQGSIAYIVMDYIEGKSVVLFESYSKDARLALLLQFLNAIEHLLQRNVIVDDLWSENILISADGRLTLIDLGGYEIIGKNADMPVKFYLKQIARMMKTIGGEAAEKALEACKPHLPEEMCKETISFGHIKPLLDWVKAIQQKLAALKKA